MLGGSKLGSLPLPGRGAGGLVWTVFVEIVGFKTLQLVYDLYSVLLSYNETVKHFQGCTRNRN